MMAPEYVTIEADGTVVGKQEDLASYATGDRHWEIAESDDYDLRIYGDTAILIGRWRGKGVNGEVHFDYVARFTAVYVRRDGRWLMVLAQSNDIAGVTATQLEAQSPSV